MKLNDTGIKLIADFEGFSDRPYYATTKEKEKGIVTIGYGCTFYPDGRKVKITDPKITRDYAIEMLKSVARKFEKEVLSLIKKPVTQNQFNALVSFAYNVGSDIDSDTIPEGLGDSTLLKLINNNPNDKKIIGEFAKWNKQSGKVINGLTKRRKIESELYFK